MTRNLIVVIQLMPNDPIIMLQKYDIETQKQSGGTFIFDVSKNHKNPKPFFDQIRANANLKSVKAISFMFIDALYFQSFEDAYAFRLKCKKFCESNEIFYHFTTNTTIEGLYALSTSKTMIEDGERVAILKILNSGEIQGYTCVRKNDCYYYFEQIDSPMPVFTQEWKDRFYMNSKPTKVILLPKLKNKNSMNVCNKLKDLFKNEDPVILEGDGPVAIFSKLSAELVLHDMEERPDPYHFSNHCLNDFRVMLSPGNFNGLGGITYEEDLLIASDIENPLPFEESAIVPVDPTKCIKLITLYPMDYFNCVDLKNFKTKKVKVTLKIDMNCFYDFKVVPIPDDPVNEMIKELSTMNICDKEKLSKKARIVTDKINLYIYVNDGNGTEYSIKDPYGTTKIPIYLSFTESKPFIGKRAKDLYQPRPEFIVFDLIKLCSITFVSDTPYWKFKAEREKESVMVTVKTFKGKHRSSVEFLLALVLRNVLQIIKNETGIKMEEFQIDFEGFEANEILKKNFIEAGKLAKVGILFG